MDCYGRKRKIVRPAPRPNQAALSPAVARRFQCV